MATADQATESLLQTQMTDAVAPAEQLMTANETAAAIAAYQLQGSSPVQSDLAEIILIVIAVSSLITAILLSFLFSVVCVIFTRKRLWSADGQVLGRNGTSDGSWVKLQPVSLHSPDTSGKQTVKQNDSKQSKKRRKSVGETKEDNMENVFHDPDARYIKTRDKNSIAQYI